MSTEFTGDHAAFQYFLASSEIDVSAISPEQSVRLYRSYQSEVARLRERVNTSLDQARHGKTRELDLDAMLQRIKQRLS